MLRHDEGRYHGHSRSYDKSNDKLFDKSYDYNYAHMVNDSKYIYVHFAGIMVFNTMTIINSKYN